MCLLYYFIILRIEIGNQRNLVLYPANLPKHILKLEWTDTHTCLHKQIWSSTERQAYIPHICFALTHKLNAHTTVHGARTHTHSTSEITQQAGLLLFNGLPTHTFSSENLTMSRFIVDKSMILFLFSVFYYIL